MRDLGCRGLSLTLMMWGLMMGLAVSSPTTTTDPTTSSPTQTSISPPKSSSSSSTATSSHTATSMSSSSSESNHSLLNSTASSAPASVEPLAISASQPTATPQLVSSTATESNLTSQPGETTTSDSSTQPLYSASPVQELYNLTDEFFKWKLQDFPEFASSVGINDETAAHLNILTPEHYDQRRITSEEFLHRAQKINTSVFSEEDHLNYKLFIYELNTYLQNFKYLKFFAPINARAGPQHSLKILVKKDTILESLNDYQKLVSRYSEFPRMAQELINIMKGNMAEGLMPSNWSLIGVTEQFENLLVPITNSTFYEPFLNINLNITKEQEETLQQQAQQAVKDMYTSFKKIRDFFQVEYFPAARPTEGVSSLPGGLDFYKACLKFHTTTDLTPQQIHDIGLSEVARIKQEVAHTAIELGLANKTLPEISKAVKEDPSQSFSSKEDLLSTYQNVVYNNLYPLMHRIVNKVPTINLTVEENISGEGYASYSDPPKDGSKPGTFYINAKIYESHKRYEVTALSLHEALPGHHLQAVTLLTNPSIPDFRKHPNYNTYQDIPAKFPLHTVYAEGWGLYSEYLGTELGLYEDPYQRIGRHSFELLRACRLVVDTGLHALGWTRQQAVDYLLENTFMTETPIKGQIDRYITWPGQACAYKMGEIKIKELRQKSVDALGQLFSLKDFHDVILGCGGPLDILEGCVDSYITKASSQDVLI